MPDDRPLDEAGRRKFDERRLDPVIIALDELLTDWLAAPAGRTPPRIGLLGGFGQGKSSVVACTQERLENHYGWWQRLKYFLLGQPFARFDVSYFKADDLEWRFVTAVLWSRVLRNLLTQGLILVPLLLVLVQLEPSLGFWSVSGCLGEGWACALWLWGAWGVLWLATPSVWPMIKSVFSALMKAKETGPANKLYLGQGDLLVQSYARFALAVPRIVVIDDLDRASVEQQRSFLRAITRFSRELDFAVVVCMDDSDLLAAPPNPEIPEELLRKTLTDELRLPDRSREDVAVLVIACLRELAKENVHHQLTPALCSVQFVADVTRVLLLSNPPSPVSPRKVLRMIARVVRHAGQLRVCQVDDLSSLLRIDGLLQLAPGLRRHLDDLRAALEVNRDEEMCALLTRFSFPELATEQVLRFFCGTSMMQPRLEDGWFYLLGGFAQQRGHDEQGTIPWQASWQLGRRSHDFFRLLLDGIELRASGFQVGLHLKSIVTANPDRKGHYWQFERPGGQTEDFLVEDLPGNFSGEDFNYLGQCWLLWVCAISTAAMDNKSGLFEQAYAWCKDSPNATLRQLFWRECLADKGHWEGIPDAIRDLWWDRALKEESTIPIDCFLAHALVSQEFSDAFNVLLHGNEVRDTRRVLHWWRNVPPEVMARRLPRGSRQIDLVSALWPVPRPHAKTAEGWKTVLAIHIRALNRINAQKGQAEFTPSAVSNAWSAGQVLFSLADCLDILYLVACFSEAESGSRWGLRGMEAWIVALDGERLRQLQELAEGGELELGSQQDMPRRYLTLLLIAVLKSWQPGNLGERAQLLLPVSRDVRELGQALETVSKRPSWWPD